MDGDEICLPVGNEVVQARRLGDGWVIDGYTCASDGLREDAEFFRFIAKNYARRANLIEALASHLDADGTIRD